MLTLQKAFAKDGGRFQEPALSTASWSATPERRPWRRASGAARAPGGLAPWVAFPLYLPFGLGGAYCTTVLVFNLSKAAVGTAQIGGFLFLGALPMLGRFLYAPLVDTLLGLRRWYAIGVVGSAASLGAIALVPATPAMMTPLTWLVCLVALAVTFITMSVEAILAHDVAPERKGAATGWKMAGGLGGSGIGGGVALWMVGAGAPGWSPAVMLAVVSLLCIPFSWMAAPRTPLAPGAGVKGEVAAVASELRNLLRSRAGLLVLLLAALPLATGGMANLLPSLAKDWRAGAGEVALVSGGLSGVVYIAGALAGGWICDRWKRRWTYCAAGAGMALTAVAMALGPRTPAAFVSLSLVYALITGVAFTSLEASVLEAIGKGAAASKSSALTAIGHMAVYGEQGVEGWVNERFNLTTMLYLEASLALGSILIYALGATLSARRGSCRAAAQFAA